MARELERSILASANDWTVPISAPLMRQLASLSAQVAGSSDYGWQASKLQTDLRDDGLYNYAPLCEFFELTWLEYVEVWKENKMKLRTKVT